MVQSSVNYKAFWNCVKTTQFMADYTWKLVLVFNWKVFVLDQTWLYHKSKAQNFHEEGLFKSKTSTKKESTALQKVGTLFSNMLRTL